MKLALDLHEACCYNECMKYDSEHGNWKGDNVGYGRLHAWVRQNKPEPKHCVDCESSPPRDLANISQEYKRDIDDWEYLCRRCHMLKDGRMNNLNRGKMPKTYCKCGEAAVTHNGVCIKQYNYLRRKDKIYIRNRKSKPCTAYLDEACQ